MTTPLFLVNRRGVMDNQKDREEILKNLDIGKEFLYLTKDEVASLGITEERILEIVKDTLISYGNKQYEMPAKVGFKPFPEVFYHAMPAYVPAQNAAGMKWIDSYPNNPKQYGLPQISGILILNDVLSGVPIAITDGTWVTTQRTPAVTAVAAEALCPKAEYFGMFGAGVQGTGHVQYIGKKLKHLKKIYIYDQYEPSMDKLIAAVQPQIDTEIIKAKNPQEIAEKCEAMGSATMVVKDTFKVVKDEWVSKGQTILACDVNSFWDPAIELRADKYIVDSRSIHELYNEQGYFPDGFPEIYAETGEVIAGVKAGRESADELIVCSNAGIAVHDVTVGREIFDTALKNGVGRKLPF
jgi:ornithine cyclodeaminase/alanine dehydrogenase